MMKNDRKQGIVWNEKHRFRLVKLLIRNYYEFLSEIAGGNE